MLIGFTWEVNFNKMSKAEKYTVDQLLGIVDKDRRSVSNLMDDESNVKDFLREYCVTDGTTLVPNYKIYYDYCRNWLPKGRKISKIGFFRKFSQVYESKRTKGTRYYLIAEGVFELDEESINDAKEFDRRARNKIKKKNEQKKQSKVSSITEEV